MLAFEVAGGREAAWQFIDATVLMSLTANLGDAKTTIVHPATTTHGRLSEQQREEAGIHQGMIRIAVGLEDVEDLRPTASAVLRPPTEPEQPSDAGSTTARKLRFLFRRLHR